MPDKPGNTPTQVFEHLWKTLDEGYVYFAEKGIDWDSVHQEFLLKITDTMDDRALYDTCVVMVNLLADPNISLKTPFAESHYSPGFNYKHNFNRYVLERYYWKNYDKVGPFIYTVIDSIGYVYYESFKEEIKNEYLDNIIERFRLRNDSITGVVFDIRDNKGGNIENAFTLLKRMGVDTTFKLSAVLYKAIYKKGPEHDAFTDPQTIFIDQGDKAKFPPQFVLLTNRGTQGVAALFATGSLGYANVRIVGDTTGGGAGMIVGAELPKGWQVRFPGSVFKTDKGKDVELGIPPTKQVDLAADDEAKGNDAILETALYIIKHP